jgi:hypothetical protein
VPSYGLHHFTPRWRRKGNALPLRSSAYSRFVFHAGYNQRSPIRSWKGTPPVSLGACSGGKFVVSSSAWFRERWPMRVQADTRTDIGVRYLRWHSESVGRLSTTDLLRNRGVRNRVNQLGSGPHLLMAKLWRVPDIPAAQGRAVHAARLASPDRKSWAARRLRLGRPQEVHASELTTQSGTDSHYRCFRCLRPRKGKR